VYGFSEKSSYARIKVSKTVADDLDAQFGSRHERFEELHAPRANLLPMLVVVTLYMFLAQTGEHKSVIGKRRASALCYV
jgi:hypothetical protein